MPKRKCPSVTSLRLFNEGQLSVADIELIGNHIEDCSACMTRLENLDPGSLEQGMMHAIVGERPEGFDSDKFDRDAVTILERVTLKDSDMSSIASYHGADLYSLIELIGHTGFGEVHRATDLVMEQPVTLILSPASSIASVDHRSQFTNDARVAGSLRHDRILHAMQFGPWDESHCYLTMPDVPSYTVAQILEGEQTFNLFSVLNVIGQVCEALEFAHRHSIVHRHLNPNTIYVSEDLDVLVAEFGLIIDGRYQFGLLQPIPKPTRFNSPEAVRNDPARIDVRSDVFSIGVLMEVLLERVAGGGDENMKSLLKIARKCQRASRRRRYQTIDQFAAAIGESVNVAS